MDGYHEILEDREAYLTGVHDGLRLALHLIVDYGLEALEELVERVEEERTWLLAAKLGMDGCERTCLKPSRKPEG